MKEIIILKRKYKKTLFLLLLISLELRALDVLCGRCSEDITAYHRVGLGEGYGGFFFPVPERLCTSPSSSLHPIGDYGDPCPASPAGPISVGTNGRDGTS